MTTGWSEQEYRRRDAAGICEHSLSIRFDNDRHKVTRVVQKLLAAVDQLEWMTEQARVYAGVALEEALLNAVIHERFEKALAEASMCGKRFDPAQHARLLQLARACQSHHQAIPNFAPPTKQWTADLPTAALTLMLAHAGGPERAPPAYAATRSMSPNEHPPRLLS